MSYIDNRRRRLVEWPLTAALLSLILVVPVSAQGLGAPVANNDSYAVQENQVLTVGAPGVLVNDTGGGDSLQAILATGTSYGVLTLNPNGSLIYTPNVGFLGTDSFTYQDKDTVTGAMSNPATVTITTLAFSTIYSFTGSSSEGAYPETGLAQGSDGNFYGVDFYGPGNGNGTVFKVTPGGAITALYTFTGPGGLTPESELVLGGDGNFYGFATEASPNVLGNIFKISPNGAVSILYPYGSHSTLITGPSGDLYGTTFDGGVNNSGSIFTFGLGGSGTSVLYSFSGSVANGNYPYAGLTLASDGNYYGTTTDKTDGNGTIFQFTPSGTLTSLHTFNGLDGYYILSSLVQGSDGSLYGTSPYGGNAGGFNGDGSIFKIATNGVFTTLHAFVGLDGAFPAAGLMLATDGDLYGVTYRGGVNNDGTVYRIGPSDAFTTLYSFSGPDGVNPLTFGTLVQGADGSLYGTTEAGGSDYGSSGSSGYGTVFRLNLNLRPPPPTIPPLANNDSYSVAEAQSLTVAAPGVLANDSDIYSDLVTAVLVSNPSNGSLTFNANGAFTYTPNAGFIGTDTFTYYAQDSGHPSLVSNAATVSVNVYSPVTVATPAAATPNPVTNTMTNLSVLGAYAGTGGAASLTYTWSSTGSGPVIFSVNGTNAAKNTVATFTKAGTYTFTATISCPVGTSTTSSVNVTVGQTLTSVAVTPGPTLALTLVTTQQFAATALDQFGNAMASQPTFSWTLTSGVGSIGSTTGLYHTGQTPGTATIKGKVGSISGLCAITVSAPLPTVATAAAASPNPVSGTSTNLSVLGAYSGTGGAGALTYTWSEIAGPSGVTFSVNGTNAAAACTAAFTQAGSYTLQATIANPYGGTATSSVNVTVNQTLTSVTVVPNGVTVDVGGVQTFTATANDQFGNPLATQPGFAWSLGTGSVGSINASTGVYSAGLLPGSATVRATTGPITVSASVTIIDPGPTVATAASANPSAVTGTTTALSALGADAAGESGLTYTWSSTGPAAVTYSDNGDNTAKNTTATFTAAGAYVFTVTIANAYGGTATSSVNVTVSQTLTSIAVSPASVSLSVGGGDTFSAIAYDQFGTALGTQPTFAWSVDSGGVGTIDPASGIYAAGLAPGSATVRATVGSVSGTALVTVTDAGPAVVTNASATPNPVTATTTTLATLGADPDGEPTLTYTWSSTGPAAITYSDNGDNSAKNTTATFTEAGAYVITVTIANAYGGTTTSTVNVTVSQTLTSIAVSPSPVTLTLGGGDTFSAIAYDQFGTAMGTQPTFAWSVDSGGVGTIDPASGIYAAGPTPGSATVRATSGPTSGTASVSVADPGPTVAAAAAAAPNPVTGTTTALSVLGADPTGESTLTYTWSSTGPAAVTYSDNGDNSAKNATATFTAAGAYVLTVTIANPYGGTTTSTVNVTVNQTYTSIALTPGPTLTVTAPATQQFTATASDQFGNPMATQPAFTWSLASGSVGSVTSSGGLYHSGTVPGAATIKAKSGAISATAGVTVNPAPVTVAAVAAANPNPAAGVMTTLSAMGAYAGAGSLTYTWSVTGPGSVTYSANGTTAASNTTATFTQAGVYTFMVTIASPYTSTTSSVTVTVNQTLTSIVVTPGPTLIMNPPLPVTQQFTATALDQFGAALVTQPAFTWTLASGSVGSVSSTTGLYHSGTVAGTATVRARSGAIMGTAAVAVN